MKEDDITPEMFGEMMKEVGKIITTDLSKDARRNRPYDGPAHTDEGERGKTLVEGLTMRDVCDCMALGLLDASGEPALQDAAERGAWTYNDLYQLGDFDPVAAIQSMACRLEMMMGIFPNVPGIKFPDEEVGEDTGEGKEWEK